MACTTDDVERPGAQEWVPEKRTVETLRAAAERCRGCELWEPATQVVFSAGPGDARVMLVGEQPGDQEDRQGEPFVGPAGQLLSRGAEDAGLDRDTLYVTNAVKHFRFTQAGEGKRRIHEKPGTVHMVACRPWLDAELEVVDPELVVALGATAARVLLGATFRLTKQRGTVLDTVGPDGVSRPMLATLHPSAVLRMRGADREPAYKGLVSDLRVVADYLGR